MQMMNESMMGGPSGADIQPNIRPFWEELKRTTVKATEWIN